MLRSLFASLVLVLAACGSSNDSAKTAPPTACIPAQNVFCRCGADTADPGGDGTQTCSDDGSAFSACGPCDQPSGSAICGDGSIETGETCDDGNATSGDGCSSVCQTEGASSTCKADYTGVANAQKTSLSNPFPPRASTDQGSCGGDGPELVIEVDVQSSGVLVLNAQGAGDVVVLYVRKGDCLGTELACVTDGAAGDAATTSLDVVVGDVYYVYVDSQGAPTGPLTLSGVVTSSSCGGMSGMACDTGKRGACAAGTYACDGGAPSCVETNQPAAQEVCGNGIDDDCNGDIDDGCPCAHDLCTTGVLLPNGCANAMGVVDPCLTTICKPSADGGDGEYCCGNMWDDKCVAAVQILCKRLTCDASAGVCAHPLCTTGDPLAASCDTQDAPAITSCVTKICNATPSCCTDSWTDACVAEVASVCGKTCE